MSNNLVIINNESVFNENNSFYCDNIDMQSIPEGINKNVEVSLILRKSKIKRSHKINLNKIIINSNIFRFLLSIYKTFKKKETNYLIISITPYTFFAYMLLIIYRKKIFLYLRSNGYEEYKAILGFIGPLLYHVMFTFVTLKSNIIVCQEKLYNKKKVELVNPSQLDHYWLQNTTKALLDKPRLLYVGRIKIEKGIFSLIEIFQKMSSDFQLSIVGKPESSKLQNIKNVNYLGYVNSSEELRKIYDDHNIFILPSFTEAHPQALDEALARKRPVIVFEEIAHVIKSKKGVFVSKRNITDLKQTIDFIFTNYSNINEDMKKNKLPTKQDFISQMTNILN